MYWNKVSPQFALMVKKDDSLLGVRMLINFDENWAACSACQELINKGDREALTKRACEAEGVGPGHPAQAYMKRVHELVLENRLNIPPIVKGQENNG